MDLTKIIQGILDNPDYDSLPKEPRNYNWNYKGTFENSDRTKKLQIEDEDKAYFNEMINFNLTKGFNVPNYNYDYNTSKIDETRTTNSQFNDRVNILQPSGSEQQLDRQLDLTGAPIKQIQEEENVLKEIKRLQQELTKLNKIPEEDLTDEQLQKKEDLTERLANMRGNYTSQNKSVQRTENTLNKNIMKYLNGTKNRAGITRSLNNHIQAGRLTNTEVNKMILAATNRLTDERGALSAEQQNNLDLMLDRFPMVEGQEEDNFQ